MLKLKLQYFGHWCKELTHWERLWCWERLKVGEKGDDREDEMVGWHHWLDEHEFEQAPGVGDGQGSLACCSPWDPKESDMTEQPIWTKLNWTEPPWAGWSLKTDNIDLCDLSNYLTTHQSENCAWADHIPCDPLPHTVFKNPFLKVTGEFWSFEHELPILPA